MTDSFERKEIDKIREDLNKIEEAIKKELLDGTSPQALLGKYGNKVKSLLAMVNIVDFTDELFLNYIIQFKES